MLNYGFVATPTIGLFLLSVRLIKNHTDLLIDSVQNIINITTPYILIAAMFTKRTMFQRAYLIGNLTMTVSGFPLADTISSYLACGKTHAIEKNTLLHHSPNKVPLETILRHQDSIKLNIDTSHYRGVPEDFTAYGLSKPNPIKDHLDNIDGLIADFKSKIGEEKYFQKMLLLYKNQQELSTKDKEKLDLLEQAWAKTLSDDKLKEAEEKLSGLTEEKIAQIAQWETANNIDLCSVPEGPIRERLKVSKAAAIKGLKEHQEDLENFKILSDIESIKENMENRKKYYRDFFVKKFVSVLKQLNAGNFTQGGTIKTDAVKKEMSFVLNAIQKDLASDDPIYRDNALNNFTQLIERCHFCNSGMTESLRTLRIQMNTFTEHVNDTIKNQIYYLLQLHREQQSKFIAKAEIERVEKYVAKFMQGYFSNDVHKLQEVMAFYNTQMNFATDSNISIFSTADYFFTTVSNLITNLASKGWHSNLITKYINPKDITSRIVEQMKISEPFRKRVMEWKDQYVQDLSDSYHDLARELQQTTDEESLVQLLLIDTGVLKATKK